MSFDHFVTAFLVLGMSLGTAAVIVACIVIAERGNRRDPAPQPETQDDFTAAIRRWGAMQDGVRK